MGGWDVTFFKVALCACGPVPSESFLNRCLGCVQNAMETEPFFLAMALGIAVRGKSKEWVATLLKAFGVVRCADALVFLAGIPQPVRALTYLAGVFPHLGLAEAIVTGNA